MAGLDGCSWGWGCAADAGAAAAATGSSGLLATAATVACLDASLRFSGAMTGERRMEVINQNKDYVRRLREQSTIA
jgi:hypothetical protein